MSVKVCFLFSVFDRLFCDLITVNNQKSSAQKIQAYGFAYARKPFFAEAPLEELYFVSDFYACKEPLDLGFLATMEATTGLKIAELIHLDRHLMRVAADRRLAFACHLLKKWVECIDRNGIQLVVSAGAADLLSVFACEYARCTQKLKFIYLFPARLEDYYYFSDQINNSPLGFKQNYDADYASLNEAEQTALRHYCESYFAGKKMPVYLADKTMHFNKLNFADCGRFFNYLYLYLKDPKGMHYDRSPLLLPYYRWQRICRARAYKAIIQLRLVNPKQLPQPYQNYYVYPLHFHPEASTLVLGRAFNDQIRIIEMISKSLRADTLLIVKEHKVSIGRRAPEFYKKIASFHNVRFVDAYADVPHLLRHSQGVFTISSSMGLEALMLGKPVFCIGDVFYAISANVFPITQINEIAATVERAKIIAFDEKSVLALIKTVLSSSFQLGYLRATEYTTTQLNILSEKLQEIIVGLGE